MRVAGLCGILSSGLHEADRRVPWRRDCLIEAFLEPLEAQASVIDPVHDPRTRAENASHYEGTIDGLEHS